MICDEGRRRSDGSQRAEGQSSAAASQIDAQVLLVKRGVRYMLTPSPGDSGFYHYPGADLTVKEGDVFNLEVTYAGTVATAQTTVPSPPETLVLSDDSLVIPTVGFGFRPGSFGTQLLARWPNPELELFFVTVEALEESPMPINIGIGRGDGFRHFIFPPIAADSFAISPLSLAHYGLHQVRVYHVNTEYAALYESRQQDTRDLNEPATNIRNGLGVFSAFGSRTVLFRAVAAE